MGVVGSDVCSCGTTSGVTGSVVVASSVIGVVVGVVVGVSMSDSVVVAISGSGMTGVSSVTGTASGSGVSSAGGTISSVGTTASGMSPSMTVATCSVLLVSAMSVAMRMPKPPRIMLVRVRGFMGLVYHLRFYGMWVMGITFIFLFSLYQGGASENLLEIKFSDGLDKI